MISKEEFQSQFCVSSTQALIWGDMDAFQHINNTVYFRYFENVRIAYFDAVGINQFMEETNVGPILGYTQCKYLAPLTFPDKIIIGTNVIEVNQKRFTMAYQIFSEKLSQVVATGTGEIIYLDYTSGKTCAIPDEIRQKMASKSLAAS